MSARKVVAVPYFYPPFPGAGIRWAAMARHLRQHGHSVSIVATAAFGSLDDDHENGVLRVGDLRTSPRLRRLLRRDELPVAGSSAPEPPESRLLTQVLVPDAQVLSWMPAALACIRRLADAGEIDCLVTSSPPESTHLIGLLLGRRRPAWVAEFRDGWLFEPLRKPFPTAAQRAFDARLERRVVTAADVVVGATLPIAEDVRQRFDAQACWVSNGWDPDDPAINASTDLEPVAAGALSLIHTGTLFVRGFDGGPLLRALALVRGEGLDLRLVCTGALRESDRAALARVGVEDAVEYVGRLARADALAAQRAATALLLVTSSDRSVATSKLFEYIGAGRPIVALARGNEAERIVRETNTGVVVPPDDVEAIAAALRSVASGELAAAYRPQQIEQYTYPRPAEAMAEAIDAAIRRRAAQR